VLKTDIRRQAKEFVPLSSNRSEYRDGKHIVICPNKLNSGVTENATRNIKKMRKNCTKRTSQNFKKQNLATANLSDLDEASHQQIREQIQQANSTCVATDGASVGLSITTLSSPPKAQDAGTGHGLCG